MQEGALYPQRDRETTGAVRSTLGSQLGRGETYEHQREGKAYQIPQQPPQRLSREPSFGSKSASAGAKSSTIVSATPKATVTSSTAATTAGGRSTSAHLCGRPFFAVDIAVVAQRFRSSRVRSRKQRRRRLAPQLQPPLQRLHQKDASLRRLRCSPLS